MIKSNYTIWTNFSDVALLTESFRKLKSRKSGSFNLYLKIHYKHFYIHDQRSDFIACTSLHLISHKTQICEICDKNISNEK